MPKVTSILELLDITSGKTTELARFDYLIEAPFFRGENELLYNSDGRIYRMMMDTKEIAQIPTGYCTGCNNDHVLSPDGKLLAVSHGTAEDGQSRIYIINLEDPADPPRLVTPLAPSYLHGWSADGKTLAYCASRKGEYDVYVVPAEGGVEKQLTFTEGLNDGPEYSSDGKYIYFNSVRGGLMDCYRMDVDGGNVVKLTDNGKNNWFPHVSPDCKTIVYIAYDASEVPPGSHPSNKNVELRKMNPDGSGDELVLKLFGGQGTINVNSWMPDSKRLAFVRYETGLA